MHEYFVHEPVARLGHRHIGLGRVVLFRRPISIRVDHASVHFPVLGHEVHTLQLLDMSPMLDLRVTGSAASHPEPSKALTSSSSVPIKPTFNGSPGMPW